MNVTDGIYVRANGIANLAFVELHMVRIVQNAQLRRANQANDLRRHLRVLQKIADMVGGDVQTFQIHLDAALLRNLCAVEQHIVHGAQLYCVGQVIIMVDNNAAIAQCVGVNGHALCTNLLCSCYRLLQELQILLLVGRINQRIFRIAVKSTDANTCLLCGCLDRV